MYRNPGKLKLRMVVAGVFVAALSVSGCSSTNIAPKAAAQSSETVKLKNIATKRLGEGAVAGAFLGAAGLGLITALRGGDGKQIAQAAAVGAVLGAASGAIFATTVNKSAEQQAREQERYQVILKQADDNIAVYKRASSSAAAVVRAENNRIPGLNAQLKAGSISAAQYRSQIADAKDNVAALDRLISDASVDINDMNVMIGTTGPDPLKARKASLVAEKASLERQKQALLDAYSRVTPEIGLKV